MTRAVPPDMAHPIMNDDFYRIRRLPPYVFAEVNAMKARARAEGEDIIDLGMGNPDGAPAPHIIEKLCEVARDPGAHGYSASKGIKGLRKAQAGYYQRRFGVDLDPDTEVVVTLGSKEGLANLAQAITAPGDVVLAPNPSYPIHTFGFIITGAAIRSIPAAPGPIGARWFQRRPHAPPKGSATVRLRAKRLRVLLISANDWRRGALTQNPWLKGSSNSRCASEIDPTSCASFVGLPW